MKIKRARRVNLKAPNVMPFLEIEWADGSMPKAVIYHEDIVRNLDRASRFEMDPWVVLGEEFKGKVEGVRRTFPGIGEYWFETGIDDPQVIDIARRYLELEGPGEIPIEESEA